VFANEASSLFHMAGRLHLDSGVMRSLNSRAGTCAALIGLGGIEAPRLERRDLRGGKTSRRVAAVGQG